MYKIFQLGDIHLGATPGGIPQRGRDIDYALSQFAMKVEDESPDAILLTGDVFDHPNIYPDDLNAILNLMDTLRETGTPLFWAGGNHDSVDRDGVKRKDADWPCILGRWGEVDVKPEQLDPRTDLPVPYTLEKEGEDPISICPINWRPRSIIRQLLSDLPENFCDIILMHQSLEGVIAEIGNPEISPADLEGKAKYFALGDIHLRRELAIGSGPTSGMAVYAGPLEWLSRAQVNENGFVEVLYDNSGVMVPSLNIERRSLPTRHYVRIDIGPGEIVNFTEGLSSIATFDQDSTTVREFEIGDANCRMIAILPKMTKRDNYSPGVFFDVKYRRSVDGSTRDLAKAFVRFLEEHFPGDLAVQSEIPSIDSPSDYDSTSDEEDGDNQCISMEQAIESMTEEDEEDVTRVALSIWSSPESIDNIIEGELNEA